MANVVCADHATGRIRNSTNKLPRAMPIVLSQTYKHGWKTVAARISRMRTSRIYSRMTSSSLGVCLRISRFVLAILMMLHLSTELTQTDIMSVLTLGYCLGERTHVLFAEN